MPPRRIRTVKGSCWRCKDRRIKCDLTQPICERCADSGLICEYGKVRLRWSKPATAYTLPSESAFSDLMSLANPPRQPRFILDSECYMLYFERDLIPRFHLLDKFLHIDILSLLENPLLLHSATAVASAHHTLSKGPSSDSLLSMAHSRTEAVKVLRENLLQADGDASPSKLFTANALLCILDGMIEPSIGSKAAHEHLRGGRAILDAWGCKDELFESKSGVTTLMLSVFASMDLTHAILSGDAPYLEDTEWTRFADAECWWGILEEGDPFLQITALTSRLAILGHHVHNSATLVPVSTLLAIQLSLERTSYDRDLLPPLPDFFDTGDLEKQSWRIFCSAYRYAALIYLYRVLCKEEVRYYMIQELVAEGVEAISHPALTGKHAHCVLFPALVLGCHCVDETQRTTIRKIILSSASFLSFGCVNTMDDFLCATWKTDMTFSWFECFESISETGFFF